MGKRGGNWEKKENWTGNGREMEGKKVKEKGKKMGRGKGRE